MQIREGVPLAPLTTLGLGGPARWLAEVGEEAELREAVVWAASRRLALRLLGGGSTLVIADGGVDGLVLQVGLSGVRAERRGDEVLVTAAAGEPWDGFVARCVGERWQGIECLSGIPGTVGGTPKIGRAHV